MTYSGIKKFSEVITLRGHHLLCIQGFQGYGYSEEFVENLANIILILEDNPHQKIRIVTECDDICLFCPWRDGNSCQSSSSTNRFIKKMDKAVIEHLNLNIDQDYHYNDLQKQVLREEHFHDLKKICGNCSWKKDCTFYKKE